MGSDAFKDVIPNSIPVDWTIKTIGEIAETKKFAIVDGPFGTQMKVSEFTNTGIPVVEMEHLRKGLSKSQIRRYVSLEKYEEVKRSTIIPGDIVISKTGTLGLVGMVPIDIEKAIITSRLAKISVNAELGDINFVYYYLTYIRLLGYWETIGEGSTMKVLTIPKISNVSIPLPPLPEQRTIAYVLNTVRQSIEATERVIEAAHELKRSMMQHLFTYGPVSVMEGRGVSLKETEMGEVPVDWEKLKVDDVFEIKLGKMLSGASRKGISPRPYIRNANVQWGYFDLSDIAEMDFTPQEKEKFRLKENDILVCEGGEIGRTAIWKNELPECYYQKAIHRLRPKLSNIVTEFFLY
jgi:type I restriction enzyme S subunit